MKKLTFNRVAGAGFKANRRAYRALAAGIFLAIFMITSLCLCVQGVYLAMREKQAQELGYEDIILINDVPDDEAMRLTGFFDRIGHVYVTGNVTGYEKYLGWYDEEAAALLNRHMSEGRMPEQPGEIAVERSALELMRVDKSVGDELTLSITPIDGVAEERSFSIVGILREQSNAMNDGMGWVETAVGTMKMPSMLTCAQEPAYATGRYVVHRPATLTKMTSMQSVVHYYRNEGGWNWNPIFIYNGDARWDYNEDFANNLFFDPSVIFMYMLGFSLILSTCVGIAGAMEGRIAHRTEEIGMLRAVGATRRQIRRIFGREAWLLAWLLAPPALACGCLFAWLLAKFAPDQFVFRPSPMLLIPVFLLSVVCILLSANLPLRRASRIMPMGVLRDTALLRKSRRFHSRKIFNPARLIAMRQNMLHPTRQFGSALLVGLMFISLVMGTYVAIIMLDDPLSKSDVAIEMRQDDYGMNMEFAENMSYRSLTDQDIAQVGALPGVKRMEVARMMAVSMVLDHSPEVYKTETYENQHLFTEDEYRNLRYEELKMDNSYRIAEGATPETLDVSQYMQRCADHDAARDAWGIDREQFMVRDVMYVLPIDPDDFRSCEMEGSIDMDAINAGRAILAYAPDMYIDYEIFQGGYLRRTYPYAPEGVQIERYIKNDTLSVGQTLPLIHAYIRDYDPFETYAEDQAYEYFYSKYSGIDCERADVSVCAVLKQLPNDIGERLGRYGTMLLTTPQGAAAMGFNAEKLYYANIYVDDGLSVEDEKELFGRVESIAMRGEDVYAANRLEQARINAEYNRSMMMVFAGIIALFFAVSVAMITGGITRRIRADERMIGTLRAVGADERVIARCYSSQVTLSIVLGLIIMLISVTVVLIWQWVLWSGYWSGYYIAEMYPLWIASYCLLAVTVFTVLCFASCRFILKLRVREIMNRSIVENVREV